MSKALVIVLLLSFFLGLGGGWFLRWLWKEVP